MVNRLQKIVDKTSYSAACAACKAAKDVGLNNESDVALRTGPLFLLVGCAVVALGFHGIEDADIAAVMLLVGAIFGLVGPIVTLVGVWAKLTGGPRRVDFLLPTEAWLEYHAHRE
ncbi:hypothetical protein HYS28_02360, partial [Candidatus Uhrbacteria bacterium]|nr:hypothetical protein [Candidatus Uhrbacteria bacterium]